MCFPAYDPSTESAHGSKDKLESEKYRAVENLIKSISPNLNEETRQKLATEILHEIRLLFPTQNMKLFCFSI